MVKSVCAALFVAPLAMLTACSPNEPVATTPGTPPPVWTGSPAPGPTDGGHAGGAMHGGTGHLDAPAAAGPTDTLTALIRTADGTQVAAATIDFSGGFATVTVQTTGAGGLTPGPHGLHIHTVGKCEPDSVAPAGGPPGDFLSAGGHFAGGGDEHPGHAGDLSSLQVRPDGTAMLVTTSSAFTKDQLLAAPGTAIIIHAGADNFANIPGDRYQQTNGAAPPDAATLATGDAGKRVACGVIGAG
ncbi:MAG: superoxide dismutase family protein [Mycobacteriaceae bacterium]